MPIRYPDSYMKNLTQISVVAKRPFEVGSKMMVPPNTLSISQTFFRKYGCYLNCGGCCSGDISLDYLPSEVMDVIHEVGITPEVRWTVPINGEPRELFTIPQEPQTLHGHQFCRFLDPTDAHCTIHEKNPFSCQIELIKFRRMKDRGYMMKVPFGRAWALHRFDGVKGQVLCTFDDFALDQLKNNDIPALQRMLEWAEYLDIPTYLPEILDSLERSILTGRFLGRLIHRNHILAD